MTLSDGSGSSPVLPGDSRCPSGHVRPQATQTERGRHGSLLCPLKRVFCHLHAELHISGRGNGPAAPRIRSHQHFWEAGEDAARPSQLSRAVPAHGLSAHGLSPHTRAVTCCA